ncbi:hypothetical protein PoB_006424700 [Plakobranchus ocellatus]|uniref:Uncharacterized protein n=1 Tax=Plakobranchus ocellatus TaxID=259542 RepID=A0AAV4D0N4_9GAST|nr:hypothetical protein PoB_006424700 [Plakobranchus ocellatus]
MLSAFPQGRASVTDLNSSQKGPCRSLATVPPKPRKCERTEITCSTIHTGRKSRAHAGKFESLKGRFKQADMANAEGIRASAVPPRQAKAQTEREHNSIPQSRRSLMLL